MTTDEAPQILEEKLAGSWGLSNIFSNGQSRAGDIYDFEMENYRHFLDNVTTLENLISGLRELSPFADDALAVAERMTFPDFCDFKLGLAAERRRHALDFEEGSVLLQTDIPHVWMPEEFLVIVLPQLLMDALPLATRCVAPLGTALIRIMELDHGL